MQKFKVQMKRNGSSYAPEVRDHVHQQRALSSRLYSYAEDHNDKF